MITEFAALRPESQQEVREFIREFASQGPERRQEVAELIKEFASQAPERQKEVAELLREFASQGPERQTEVVEMLKEFASMAPERREDVAAMIKEFAAMAPERKMELWGAPVSPRDTGYIPIPIKDDSPEIKPVQVTPEFQRRLFKYLASHPHGTRYAELENEFGLPRVEMLRVLKKFMDEKKVKMRDSLVFGIHVSPRKEAGKK